MVKISFPNPNDYEGNAKAFLRQLELAVHHSQKALEELEKESSWKDGERIIVYRFPKIDLYNREQDEKGRVLVHVDEEGDQMQNIELEFSLL